MEGRESDRTSLDAIKPFFEKIELNKILVSLVVAMLGQNSIQSQEFL